MNDSSQTNPGEALSIRIADGMTQQRAGVPASERSARPLIGVFAPGGILRDGAWQVYGLDQPVTDAIFGAGGFPLGIAGMPVIRGLDTFEIFSDADAFRAVFDVLWPALLSLDGLLLPGGGDLDSRLYVQAPHPRLQNPDLWLDILQLLATLIAWVTRLPTFGVCRGLQMMNVALGGDLFQDHQELQQRWSRNMPPLLAHRRGRPTLSNLVNNHHPLLIRPRSWLAQAVRGRGKHRPPRYHLDAVLSVHHNFVGVCRPGSDEVLGRLADGLQVAATAPDGVIEAIGDTDPQRTFVGVQFHPEYVTSLEWSMGIFTWFVDACACSARLSRAELESFREEVCAWVWHTVRRRIVGEDQEFPEASAAHTQAEGVRSDADAHPERDNHAIHASV